jgi:hypothetical protein
MDSSRRNSNPREGKRQSSLPRLSRELTMLRKLLQLIAGRYRRGGGEVRFEKPGRTRVLASAAR